MSSLSNEIIALDVFLGSNLPLNFVLATKIIPLQKPLSRKIVEVEFYQTNKYLLEIMYKPISSIL